MESLTNETIRGAIKPWLTSDPESHANYAESVKRFGHISKWNVSAVTNMRGMFYRAMAFNQDISAWNVSVVTDMSGMFYEATAFNQDISEWNVSAVTDMHWMFHSATAFNQDLSKWNVSAVTNMQFMFYEATAFNQILHKYKLTHPFNLLQTHTYHNWTRRKWFVHTETFNCTDTQNKFVVQTALTIPEMKQEIGLFV